MTARGNIKKKKCKHKRRKGLFHTQSQLREGSKEQPFFRTDLLEHGMDLEEVLLSVLWTGKTALDVTG